MVDCGNSLEYCVPTTTFTTVIKMMTWEADSPVENKQKEYLLFAEAFLYLLLACSLAYGAYQDQGSTSHSSTLSLWLLGVLAPMLCVLRAIWCGYPAAIIWSQRRLLLKTHEASSIGEISEDNARSYAEYLKLQINLKSIRVQKLLRENPKPDTREQFIEIATAKGALDEACDQHREYVEALVTHRFRFAKYLYTTKGHDHY